jgi:hypothetical protein
MLIKKKEVIAAIALGTIVTLLAVVYLGTRNEARRSELFAVKTTRETNAFVNSERDSQVSQTYYQLITETIEGELEKGAFEDTVDRLTILTDEEDGYVKSLRMTYEDEAWSGQMLCKVPPANVTSFTFGARAIIASNGTVTYINISVESINATDLAQEEEFSSINLDLKEKKPSDTGVGASLEPVAQILSTSVFWIAQGLIVGLPLCFVSLGIVLLFNRGIIPLWKNLLKTSKQLLKKEAA